MRPLSPPMLTAQQPALCVKTKWKEESETEFGNIYLPIRSLTVINCQNYLCSTGKALEL
jgi:hypothetical protein